MVEVDGPGSGVTVWFVVVVSAGVVVLVSPAVVDVVEAGSVVEVGPVVGVGVVVVGWPSGPRPGKIRSSVTGLQFPCSAREGWDTTKSDPSNAKATIKPASLPTMRIEATRPRRVVEPHRGVLRCSTMKRNRVLGIAPLAVALLVVVAACNNSEEAELTTTSTLIGQTTAPGSDSSSTTADGSSTTLAGQPVTDSEIVSRQSTDDGETLYILIPVGAYTDVDLENFVGDLIESDDNIESAEIFDDPAALQAYLLNESERTAADLVLIDEHHLVSLVDRNVIRFQGPFAEYGEYTIGS